MSELTIPARLVAEGVGLTGVWLYCDEVRSGLWHITAETHTWGTQRVDLSDPQTAFGLALKLDEWERAGNPYWYCTDTWAARVLCELQDPNGPATGHREDLAARLTQIGMEAIAKKEAEDARAD